VSAVIASVLLMVGYFFNLLAVGDSHAMAFNVSSRERSNITLLYVHPHELSLRTFGASITVF